MDNATSKKIALLAAMSSSFLTAFTGSSVNIALPAIGRHFAMDAVLLSWVQTAYLLAAAMFLVPFGRLADIHGRKKIYVWGITVFAVASWSCGMVASAPLLIGLRVLQGLGSAMIFGTGVAILTSVYPPGERGRALGITIASVYIGLSLGPVLGGFLTERWGWRSVFFANLPIALVVIGLVLWRLRGEWAEARGEPFDPVGSVIYGLTLISVMYGLSQLPGETGVGLIALGGLGLLLFLWWESRVSKPVLELNLFRHSRAFAFSNLAALINYAATAAVAFLMSLYLQYIQEMSAQQAGLVLIVQPLVQALLSPLAGRLSDRIEPQVVASMGMGSTTLGLFLFLFLGRTTPKAFIYVSLVLLGLGFALFSSPNTNAVMSAVQKRHYGVASATVGTMRLLGQMLSMGTVTLIFALYIGRVQITPESYPLFLKAMHTAFVVFTVACFGGIFASLARGKVRA